MFWAILKNIYNWWTNKIFKINFYLYFLVSSAATSRNRGMFGRLSDSETDSDLMLDDEEDSNLMASDGELSTSRAEKLGSIHSDSVDSNN